MTERAIVRALCKMMVPGTDCLHLETHFNHHDGNRTLPPEPPNTVESIILTLCFHLVGSYDSCFACLFVLYFIDWLDYYLR